MVDLNVSVDQTLALIEQGEVKASTAEARRGYLGMSQIGDSCMRKLWYSFRFAFRVSLPGYALRCIEDGHRMEDVMANKLRTVPGLTLHTQNPRTGRQFGYSDHGGHFSGHLDGAVLGLVAAPKTWHVWEHKSVNEKKFAALEKAKLENGELEALASWDKVYFAQAQCYMHYAGLDRHYLTVTTPGGRERTSCRTHYDKTAATVLEQKALEIINAQTPPARISENPSFYVCKMCDAHTICHKKKAPNVNCRTCVHSKAVTEASGAEWRCNLKSIKLSMSDQIAGCEKHLYNPHLVDMGRLVDASKEENWITYETKDGKKFKNGTPGPGIYSSKEIEHMTESMVDDPDIEWIRHNLDARIVG